jgi:hypothetical protein
VITNSTIFSSCNRLLLVSSFCLLFDLQDAGYMFLRNVGLPSKYTSLQPRRPHSLTDHSTVRGKVAPVCNQLSTSSALFNLVTRWRRVVSYASTGSTLLSLLYRWLGGRRVGLHAVEKSEIFTPAGTQIPIHHSSRPIPTELSRLHPKNTE